METETYKKAKEILEKFDPETKRRLEEEKRLRETPTRIPSISSPDTGKKNSMLRKMIKVKFYIVCRSKGLISHSINAV